MARTRRPRSRWLPVLTVLLVCAQFATLVGVPAITKPSSGRSRCGGSACGCRTEADRSSESCCCSTGTRTVVVDEPAACCSQSAGKTCCDLLSTAKSCCAKAKTTKTEIVWIVGLFAKSCKGQAATDWLAAEPSAPPLSPESAPVFPATSDAVSALALADISLPSIPPDPPPRSAG